MDFFGTIGNFLGSLFGQKKQQQQQNNAPAPISVSPSSSLNAKPSSPFASQQQSVQQPSSLLQPKQAPTIAPVHIGGVNQIQQPDQQSDQPSQPSVAQLPKFAQPAQSPLQQQPANPLKPVNNLPQFNGATPNRSETLADVPKDLNTAAGIANRTAARAFVGGIANAANTAGTLMGNAHYDPAEIQKRTNDFLDTIGLQDNGQNGLNSGVDYNNQAASRFGNVAGNIIGNAPVVAAQIASGSGIGNLMRGIPLLEEASTPLARAASGVTESVAAGAPATAIGQAANPSQNAQDAATNTAIDFATGAVPAAAPILARLFGRSSRQAINTAEDVGNATSDAARLTNSAEDIGKQPAAIDRVPTVPPDVRPQEPFGVPTLPIPNVQAPSIVPLADSFVTGRARPVDAPKAPEVQVGPIITNANRESVNSVEPAITTPTQPVTSPETPVAKPQDTVSEQIAKQTATPAAEPAAITEQAPKTSTAEKVAAEAPATSPAMAVQAEDKLGKIAHNAILDGSIDSPEGAQSVITRTEAAANNEAESAGDSLSNIIAKGQTAWDLSKKAGKDLTTKEAEQQIEGFTPAQQQVYKDYANELSTVANRSGVGLTDRGHQGAWYGPQQALGEDGQSAPFNPALVNELRRGQSGQTIPSANLDYSTTPYSQYIQRYADPVNAASQRMANIVETDAKGNPTGIRVPDTAKAQLESDLQGVVAKHDAALRALADGDAKKAQTLKDSMQGDIDKAFVAFADNIPGSGSARRNAINELKDLRQAYTQSAMQTLSLSNVVNRVADQGTKLVYGAEQPIARVVGKVIDPLMQNVARSEGTAVNGLNTSRNAMKAAKEMAAGTLGSNIRNNFNSTMALAGAGKNPLMKAVSKAAALPNAIGAAGTQLGDLATQNVAKALQIAASRPEAQGLESVEDYKRYFGNYMNSSQFKDDLAQVEAANNRRIGLTGAANDNMGGGGKISNFLSRNVDNGIINAARASDAKNGTNLASNPLIRNANDYVKGNITGYAGVGSRILGTATNALAGGIPDVVKAVNIAKSGDPAAVARATQLASQSVTDAITAYGVGGAAFALAKASGGAIGYTGAQPAAGSSDAAYNKANNIPANQWYINLPNGQRVYFDAARPFGAAGVAADLAGSAATGRDLPNTTGNILTQVYNQAGGSSLPNNIVDATNFINPASSAATKKLAGQQLEATLAPSTGVLNNVANATDSVKRAPTNFAQDIAANIPILRSSVPAAKDSQGNPIPNSKQVSGGSSVYSLAKNPDATPGAGADPLTSEISRLQGISGNVFPTAQNTGASKNTANINGLAHTLLNDPIYKAADDATKAEMLKGVMAGTTGKTISNSLGDGDKQALLDYTLLGKGKGAVWLEDNGNAKNYYNALYNNAQANGTLTAKDNNLNNKSGLRYQAVAAGVNVSVGADQDLQQLYHDTSQSEWRAMGNPNSDSYDPETYQKLMEYDQARTDAGVSEKSSASDQAKYVAKASGTRSGARSGSGRGGSSPNFGFANMPSSLLGIKGGTGTSSAGGYSAATPLFTPIASLQAAPTVANIPKGRSISVSKGAKV